MPSKQADLELKKKSLLMQNGCRHAVGRFGKEMGVAALQGTNHEMITVGLGLGDMIP